MSFKKVLSVVIGFGTIDFLSSVLAKIQGILFPSSLELFEQVTWASDDVIQLVIKLVCVFLSCIIGGIVTALCGGENRQQYITGVTMTFVALWLWISSVHPLWFWALLSVGIIPFVLIGSKIKQAFQ
ncbi:hypothetical protein J2X97_000651 [Epilithonimonas hungarica]|uniref:hypothetical protein n=1 Tax=Epilithonimonas hungarica TaxID=454006 RepID=UPI002780332D|nr:hypothetical protein [Epilithonimonas hungarica]MDP9955014.1 hypothetical protein [Epilithonimonas hungarica]